jgi:hypothetical protein
MLVRPPLRQGKHAGLVSNCVGRIMSLTSAFEKREVCWLGMKNLGSMKHVDLEVFKLRSILVLGKH